MKCSNCQALNELTRPRCVSCGYWLVSATDLPVGSVLSERYQLLKPLGKGGMGMVFKAHDSVLEEDVALKLLRSDIAEEPDAARRFRQEIRLARKVRHRNVCAIHEYGEDGGVRYISMELIDGVDLRQVLRRQGPPAALEAVDISIQIAEGLDAIHEAGIIHRDLKTANIMIDAQGCVRLMDFGIAKQLGGEPTLGATALGTIMGTPEYMSPEQGRGEKTDFRTDVYSLGIMVFEIFTGQLPFKGDTPIATIFKHIQEPPPLTGQLAARIPGPVVPVLAKTLAKSAEDRYQSVRDMLKALRDVRAAFNVPQDATPRRSAVSPILVGAVAPQLEPVPHDEVAPTPLPTHAPTAVRTVVPTAASLEVPAEPTAATELRYGLDPALAARPAAGGVRDLAQEGAPQEGRATEQKRSAAVRPTRFWLIAGIGGVAVVALALAVSLGNRLPRDSKEVAARVPPALASQGAGVLVVDALPWAEIVSIVGEDGKPQALGSTRYTPFVVHLPPGEYTVTLRHPQFGSSKMSTTVRASATARQVVDLGRIDAHQYLRDAGF